MWITFKRQNLKKNIRRLLMLLGSIPFWGSAVFLLNNQTEIYGLSVKNVILPSYSLVILVFLAGSHWGLSLKQENLMLKLWSNGLTLIAWFGYLILDVKNFSSLISALFVALLCIDLSLYKQKQITKKYLNERMIITAIVVSSILIIHYFLT